MLHDVIAAVSSRLVDSPSECTDGAIHGSLELLVDALGADRLTLHLCEPSGATRVRSTAGDDGPAPALPLDALPWLRGELEQLDFVQIRVGSPLPLAAAAERAHICADRLVAWLLVPMVERGRLVGVLECRSRMVGAGWPSEDVALLRVATDLVLAALRRERDAERLRERERVEALGRAAGSVAHDFNNFLTAIFGYCDELERDLAPGVDDVSRENLGEIRTAARCAEGVVAQILGFVRRSDSASRQCADPAQPVLQLRNLDGLLRRVAGKRVDFRVDRGDPSGERDAVRLRASEFDQLIVNLVSNARDAMPDGGVLEIATGRLDLTGELARRHRLAPGAYFELRVDDDGCGIDAATREHLFEPFFTTRAGDGGTGLGLATVASIVENAGGAIEVESAPGRGATFRVLLPLLRPGEKLGEKPRAAARSAAKRIPRAVLAALSA